MLKADAEKIGLKEHWNNFRNCVSCMQCGYCHIGCHYEIKQNVHHEAHTSAEQSSIILSKVRRGDHCVNHDI